MEEKDLNIVITGHVDHGKSTLIGRLFYDTGCLPPDKVAEIERISKEHGKEMEFAFLMDHLEEERDQGITIDIAHTFFKTEKRRYVIIDAPGHKEFLKNMITGTSQAEAALLLVDAAQGVQDQTLRHCYILSLLGIKQVAVLINKMDMVDYSPERFKEVSSEISDVLEKLSITPTFIIPISARSGDNVARSTEHVSWFDGPTVLDALDRFSTSEAEQSCLRFPVQDVYEIDGKKVTVGRVEAGTLKKGQKVFLLPGKSTGIVAEIMKFGEEDLKEAATGECVGIQVEGAEPERGAVIVDEVTSNITDTLRANIFWLIDKDYVPGAPLTLRCATQSAQGVIGKIFRRFDPASAEIVERDSNTIKPAEVAEVEIKLDRPVAVDKFSDIPELGRFVLEHAGHPVAGGIII
ncbi:MAG: GTP-binding protein [Thermodesulfobacteriota bacterium]|nr:MAG: GTP-binding protein [Thermodesulfobacteriota bacterium]